MRPRTRPDGRPCLSLWLNLVEVKENALRWQPGARLPACRTPATHPGGPEPVCFREPGGPVHTGLLRPSSGAGNPCLLTWDVPALPGRSCPRARLPVSPGTRALWCRRGKGFTVVSLGPRLVWAHSALSGLVLRGGKFPSPLRCFPSSVLGYLTVKEVAAPHESLLLETEADSTSRGKADR